jgi:predicted DNA-binding transcriptional regulator YafY
MSDYGRQLSRIIEIQQKLKEAEVRVSDLIDEVDRLKNLLRFIGKVVNKDRSVRFLYSDNKAICVVVPVALLCKKEELILRAYDLHRMIYGDYQLQYITPVFEETQE